MSWPLLPLLLLIITTVAGGIQLRQQWRTWHCTRTTDVYLWVHTVFFVLLATGLILQYQYPAVDRRPVFVLTLLVGAIRVLREILKLSKQRRQNAEH